MDPRATKQAIRERTWRYMEERDLARFPRPVVDRIPNFVGAERAGARAASLAVFRDADVIKANPDAPQRPLRELALREGKLLYVAVPRLRDSKPFLALDPKRADTAGASSIRGAAAKGRPTSLAEMKRVDLVIAGSVAVNRQGARVGKGGGYSDLEFALAREAGLVDEDTPVLTTVHGCQVLDEPIPMLPHDEPVDWIVTPEETIRATRAHPKPRGVSWDLLTDEDVRAIPALSATRPRERY